MNNLKYPACWDAEKSAGRQWYRRFRIKYKSILSLRTPKAMSLEQMASFNKPNVEAFFGKFNNIYERQSWFPYRIWNIDETGCSSVHCPPRVLCSTKDKQVGAATSAERGNNVTLIGCVSAAGTFIPPALVFPRVHAKPHMVTGAPAGTLCLANQTGWSNEAMFLNIL